MVNFAQEEGTYYFNYYATPQQQQETMLKAQREADYALITKLTIGSIGAGLALKCLMNFFRR